MTKRLKRAERRTRRNRLVQIEDEVRGAAAGRGLELFVNVIRSGRRGKGWSLHLMLDTQDGRRVVDYWPTTGRWWCGRTGQRGFELDPMVVVEVAAQIAAGMEQTAEQN